MSKARGPPGIPRCPLCRPRAPLGERGEVFCLDRAPSGHPLHWAGCERPGGGGGPSQHREVSPVEGSRGHVGGPLGWPGFTSCFLTLGLRVGLGSKLRRKRREAALLSILFSCPRAWFGEGTERSHLGGPEGTPTAPDPASGVTGSVTTAQTQVWSQQSGGQELGRQALPGGGGGNSRRSRAGGGGRGRPWARGSDLLSLEDVRREQPLGSSRASSWTGLHPSGGSPASPPASHPDLRIPGPARPPTCPGRAPAASVRHFEPLLLLDSGKQLDKSTDAVRPGLAVALEPPVRGPDPTAGAGPGAGRGRGGGSGSTPDTRWPFREHVSLLGIG